MASPAPLSRSIVDAAIDWAVKIHFGTPTPEVNAAFDKWLADNALHPLAWDRVQLMFGAMSGVPGAVAADVLRETQEQRVRQRARRRRALCKLAALGVVSPIAFWLGREHTPWQRLLADFSTGLGERTQVRLADGTVVDLNSDTAMSVDMAAEQRLVTLRRGEIYVRTGHDAALTRDRPFFVRTPYGLIQALGTRFTVRLAGDESRLFVDEGAVRLSPVDGGSVLLGAGESGWLARTEAGVSPRQAIDPTSWTDGVISGSRIRLADLLAEVARYRVGGIVCDPRIADLRVSGTFHIDDTDGVLRFLAHTQSLRVAYYTPLWVRVGPKY